MQELTALQRDMLFVISGLRKPSGIEVKNKLEEYYGHTINHGTIYPNLDDLAKHGLIHKGQHNKRTNAYTLTEKGETAITERTKWEASWQENDEDSQKYLAPEGVV